MSAKDKKDKKVKIQLLPGHGVGGIGGPGTEAWVSAEEAKKWVDEGYARIVGDEAEVVPSSAATPEDEDEGEDEEEEDEEDHAVMKPAKSSVYFPPAITRAGVASRRR